METAIIWRGESEKQTGRGRPGSGMGRPAQQARRKGDDRLEQVQDGAHGDAQEPEGEEQEPDDGEKKKSHEGDRPANHEQDEPEQKFYHLRASSPIIRRDTSIGSLIWGHVPRLRVPLLIFPFFRFFSRFREISL